MDHERKIYAYIYQLVPHWADADDLMQEVASLMWEKYDSFEEDTDFVAWGRKIAFYCVQNYRRKKGRTKIQFNSQLLDLLARESDDMLDQMDGRLDALRLCIKKLSVKDQEIVCEHYDSGLNVKTVADKLEYSIHQVYRALVRIHNQLMRCIRLRLSMEEMHGKP